MKRIDLEELGKMFAAGRTYFAPIEGAPEDNLLLKGINDGLAAYDAAEITEEDKAKIADLTKKLAGYDPAEYLRKATEANVGLFASIDFADPVTASVKLAEVQSAIASVAAKIAEESAEAEAGVRAELAALTEKADRACAMAFATALGYSGSKVSAKPNRAFSGLWYARGKGKDSYCEAVYYPHEKHPVLAVYSGSKGKWLEFPGVVITNRTMLVKVPYNCPASPTEADVQRVINNLGDNYKESIWQAAGLDWNCGGVAGSMPIVAHEENLPSNVVSVKALFARLGKPKFVTTAHEPSNVAQATSSVLEEAAQAEAARAEAKTD